MTGRAGSVYLLGLQRQLNEDLLQLLIHKVDAELLKSVFLKTFKNAEWIVTAAFTAKLLWSIMH